MRIAHCLFSCIILIIISIVGHAQDHSYDPPWNHPPQSAVQFTIAGLDNIPDLYGDINDPDLVIFFAGNQFMVVDSLLAAFKKQFPQYPKIFVETLPPGIITRQAIEGALTIGNMRITLKPDILTDGRSSMREKMNLYSDTLTYAFNNLQIMVRKGNPRKITGLADLARADIRVSMPNPAWEGIGKRIEEAYVKAGGEALRSKIMVDKVKDKSAILTEIHHRQSPMNILYGYADAGPVWSSEVLYQEMIGHPIEGVVIPKEQNVEVAYMAGKLKMAPHAQAASDFLQFLGSETARHIYIHYGFRVPQDRN